MPHADRNLITSLEYFSQVEEGELGRLKNLYLNDNRIASMQGIDKLTALVKLDLCCPLTIQPSTASRKSQTSRRSPASSSSTSVLLAYSAANQLRKMKHVSNFASLKKLFLSTCSPTQTTTASG